MSYVIRHKLSWDTEPPTEKEMMSHIAVALGTSPDHAERITGGGERNSWQNREEHLTAISRKWPETRFTVTCLGEDDLAWTEFYRDGKTYTEDQPVPEFDPAKLQ